MMIAPGPDRPTLSDGGRKRELDLTTAARLRNQRRWTTATMRVSKATVVTINVDHRDSAHVHREDGCSCSRAR